MIGPLLIIIGLYWFWVIWKGKAGAMWNAITGDSGFSANLDAFAQQIGPLKSDTVKGTNQSSSAPVSGNTSDSGTHMGIDSSGNIITINKDYGSMSPAEKDAANNYAHQIGNV